MISPFLLIFTSNWHYTDLKSFSGEFICRSLDLGHLNNWLSHWFAESCSAVKWVWMVLLNKSHLSTTDCCNSISSNERLFLQIHSSFSQHTLERHKYVLPICLVINLTGLFKKEQEPLTQVCHLTLQCSLLKPSNVFEKYRIVLLSGKCFHFIK